MHRLARSVQGDLLVHCFAQDLGWKNAHLLIEVDAELQTQGETRRWRAADVIARDARRKRKWLAEIAANIVALAMRHEPQGQGMVESPTYTDAGRRRLSVVVQASNELAGGCDYALSFVNQLYKTRIIHDYVELDIARCELSEEQAMATYALAAGNAAQALDTRTELVLQLTTAPIWGREQALGVAQFLGRVPFVTISAHAPVDIRQMARVVAHELAHLCGVPHVDAIDIMFPEYSRTEGFSATRELFTAGLHRWLRRPWMQEQRFFDDPCELTRQWESLLDTRLVVTPGCYSYALAVRLLDAPGTKATRCAGEVLERACAEEHERACAELAELRAHHWLD